MNKYKILIVEDDYDLAQVLSMTLEIAGFECAIAQNGEVAIACVKKQIPHIVISDVKMPVMDGFGLLAHLRKHYSYIPVLLVTGYGTIKDAVYAIQQGAFDYIQKPFDSNQLLEKIKDILCGIENDSVKTIAEDIKSKEILAMAKRAAQSDASIFISGESGTGKEVLAQYIHRHSLRKDKAFIAINCAAIPENMLEATLFGYEKGAFTGAIKPFPGKFEQAQEGTLLLDEISEMDINLQAKLLRVIQEKEVERIGSKQIISLNVRLIATTNRNLQDAIKTGKFREDLYYRLNVFPLHWPRLCERQNDIIPLAKYLLVRIKG